jgi:hypothetical protein
MLAANATQTESPSRVGFLFDSVRQVSGSNSVGRDYYSWQEASVIEAVMICDDNPCTSLPGIDRFSTQGGRTVAGTGREVTG